MIRLVLAFQTGIATKELAKRYGINVRSVRKLLREEGVKRKSWKDVRA
jgi:hypothetical protein